MLLERDHDLARLDAALEAAVGGNGRALVVEGSAGIGKTALLSAGAEEARSRGVAVLTAQGGALETGLPFGVVRRLLEEQLHDLGPEGRASVLSGAAELAVPALAPELAGGRPPDAASVLHGLFWLVAGLSERGPLLLVVDDLHWADPASLRFVAYLIRRLEGLPVLVLGAVRTGDDPKDLEALSHLLGEEDVERVHPDPLSPSAVGEILSERLGGVPDADFTGACHALTGGTPFLVHELARALEADGVAPAAASVDHLSEIGPNRVATATMLRLSLMGPAAVALVRAIAVLGDEAELPLVARLADVEHGDALAALDRLVAADVLDGGARPRFAHPLVRAAIYNDLGPGERSAAHARAAELLDGLGAGDDKVATHLLATLPAGRPDVVERLRAAAVAAHRRGAPESAVSYLRRALEEGLEPSTRATVLFELGVAEKVVRDPACVEHLQAAQAASSDPVQQAEAAVELGEVLAYGGSLEAGLAVYDAGLAALDGRDPDTELRLILRKTLGAIYSPRLRPHLDRFEQQLQDAARASPPSPGLLFVLAFIALIHREDPASARLLVERALGDGRYLSERGATDALLPLPLGVLIWLDELDRADALLDELAADAQRTGSAFGFMTVASHRVYVCCQRGDVAGALSELRHAIELVEGYGLQLGVPATLWYGTEVLLERQEVEDLVDLALALEIPPGLAESLTGGWLAELRGEILLARGERAKATAELRAAGEILAPLKMGPAMSNWRTTLALALAPDDEEEAVGLAESELADARRAGLPRGIGVALGRLGLVVGGEAGIEHLREAERFLSRSPARLEHARALVHLGAAMRRANQRADAREPLRLGLDLAHRCGATRLADTAKTELAATGARPRRLLVTGRDSLTPAERRIAKMAADGLQNAEIAQALFVTTKTVENQLGRVYKKLGIGGRAELAGALRADT